MTAFPDFGQKLDFKGPSLSANNKDKTAVSQRLAAVLILYTYKNTYKLPDNPIPIQMRLYHRKSKEGKVIL